MDPLKKDETQRTDQEVVLLRFLQITKDGKFAPIEPSSLKYTRVKEEREETFSDDDNYFYSIR